MTVTSCSVSFLSEKLSRSRPPFLKLRRHFGYFMLLTLICFNCFQCLSSPSRSSYTEPVHQSKAIILPHFAILLSFSSGAKISWMSFRECHRRFDRSNSFIGQYGSVRLIEIPIAVICSRRPSSCMWPLLGPYLLIPFWLHLPPSSYSSRLNEFSISEQLKLSWHYLGESECAFWEHSSLYLIWVEHSRSKSWLVSPPRVIVQTDRNRRTRLNE